MNQPDALPRPASFDQRIARRGCRNCIAWSAGRCRDNPGGIATEAHDWCTAWRWETNTRVGWDSAFAGLELDDSLNPACTRVHAQGNGNANSFEDGF